MRAQLIIFQVMSIKSVTLTDILRHPESDPSSPFRAVGETHLSMHLARCFFRVFFFGHCAPGLIVN